MIHENELKEYGRKQLGPNLKFCHGICLEGMRKCRKKAQSAKIQLEYKSAALPLEPTFSESSEAATMLYNICCVLPQFYDHSRS
jgi:hypothetical protein